MKQETNTLVKTTIRWRLGGIAAAIAFMGCGDMSGGEAGEADGGNGDTTERSSDSAPSSALDSGDGDGETDGEQEAWPEGKTISIDAVYEKGQTTSDMLLVNVSDEEFYDMGHIPSSLKIPWDTLSENLERVDAARHIVIYCRRGVRSESAYNTLVENGYPLVWIMEGGLEGWIEKGYPVVDE